MRLKKVSFVALTTLLLGLLLFRATESFVRVGYRNQIGLSLTKALSEQSTPLLWPYFMPLEGKGKHVPDSLFNRYAALPTLVSNDYLLISLVELLEANWSASAINLENAISSYPNNPVIGYWLGLVQYTQGSRQLAITSWEKSAALPYLLTIGYTYMQDGLYSEAREWYQIAVDLAESSETIPSSNGALGLAYRNLGKMLWDQGQFEEAIAYYEQAVIDTPNRALYRYELAQLYTIQHRFDDALQQADVLMRLEPGSASWSVVSGTIHLQANDLSLAEQAFIGSLQIGNDENVGDRCWHARAWYNLSIVYNLNQFWESSLQASLQAVRVNLGINPGWQSQLDLNFRNLLTAEPERMDWYLAIGKMYEEVGDTQTTLKYYQNAAQRWPNDQNIQDRIDHISNSQSIATGVCP